MCFQRVQARAVSKDGPGKGLILFKAYTAAMTTANSGEVCLSPTFKVGERVHLTTRKAVGFMFLLLRRRQFRAAAAAEAAADWRSAIHNVPTRPAARMASREPGLTLNMEKFSALAFAEPLSASSGSEPPAREKLLSADDRCLHNPEVVAEFVSVR